MEPQPIEEPLVAAPPENPIYVGFRCWRLSSDGRLHPLHNDSGPWDRLMRASCHKGSEHVPPYPGCMCGLWAMARPELVEHTEARDAGAAVIGAMEMGGKVLRASRGYRCQSAAVFALLMPTPAEGVDPETYAPLVKAARYHGATIVRSMEQLLALASEYGHYPPLRDVEIRRTSMSAKVAASRIPEGKLPRNPSREQAEGFVKALLPDGWRPLQAELVRDDVDTKDPQTGAVSTEVIRTMTVEVAAVSQTDPARDRLLSLIEELGHQENVEVTELKQEPQDR